MSYIFGIVDFNGREIENKELQKLDQAVKCENFISVTESFENCALGYSHFPGREPRCSIFRDEHLIFLADLRIYNLPALRSSFEFDNEFEAFAKAFIKWGVQCGNHINGDFAVVVIDQLNQEVHLIRDHIGVRPLTYGYCEGRLIFSSHEYGIVKSELLPTKLSEEKLIRRLFWFESNYTQTAFLDVFKVTPGNSVSFTKAEKKVETWWNPADIKTNLQISFDDAVIRLRELLIQATKARIEPGKIGVHVSGGLDSTGIACILADHIDDKNRLIGYSWTPEELNDAGEEQNEKEYIDAFSADKGVPVRYLKLEKNEFVQDSIEPEFEIMHIEYPTIRMAGGDGITTLFSGWGGDEFLSLSTRGVLNHFIFNFKLAWLFRFIRKHGVRSSIYRLRTEFLPQIIPFGLLPTFRGTDWTILRLLKPTFILKNWKLIFFHKRKNVYGFGNRKGFIMNLLNMYHIPARMDSWAYYSEKFGFEYKYPLLDKDVLDFWFSLPVGFTYRKLESRLLYREIMKGILIESIRTRKDKSETLRIKYSLQNMVEGKEYLKKQFEEIPNDEHLPYFKVAAMQKLLNDPIPEKRPEKWRYIEKLCFYLRNLGLVRKYLSK